ncbi:hypothetical protein [Erysipelothrix aquatica]|uniref:hypothetical protein n=1 Tax=Erysipelothrix aquatica TaxID=2683714 RepID=UPI001359EBA4|nr:hypothetical protein [Erysipelothrix aquatica]
MTNYEFMGMIVLVAIPTVTSIFKLSISIAKFANAVENLTAWQKVKDDKDEEQDRRLNNHQQEIDKIKNTHFEKNRIN